MVLHVGFALQLASRWMQEHAPHDRTKDFAKKSLFAVDEGRERDIFVIPPEAGPELIRVVLATFGTAN